MIILIDMPDDVVKDLHGKLPEELEDKGSYMVERMCKTILAGELIKIFGSRSELVARWAKELVLSAQDKEFDKSTLKFILNSILDSLDKQNNSQGEIK